MLRALLGRLTDADLADSIVGDLEEQRRERTRESAIRAFAWHVMAMAGIVGSISLRKLRESFRAVWSSGRGFSPLPEIRHAVRSLGGALWYSAAVVFVIALSMALATTVFAIVDGVLFKAVPYPNPDRLFAIAAWNSAQAEPTHRMAVISPADVRSWTAAIPDDALTAFVVGDSYPIGENEYVRSAQVDARFFEVLGVFPLVGGFDAAHFVARAPIRPALLTHVFWQGRFGGDPAVLGRTLPDRRGTGIEVVGILPPGFVFPYASAGFAPSFLTPNVLDTESSSEGRSEYALVRLMRGRNVADAQGRLTAAAQNRAAAMAGRAESSQRAFDRVRLDPIRIALTGPVRDTSWIVVAIAATLLALACLNVTGLGVARLRDRSRDHDLRRALGAGTFDLVRLLLTENAIIVATGGAVGIALAYPMLTMTLALMPNLMLLKAPSIDLRVAAFAVVAASACLLAVTLWPARGIAAASLRSSLADAGGTTRGARRARTILIAAQIALAFFMTVGGALLVGSLVRVWGEDVGFDVDRHGLVTMNPPVGTSGAQIEDLVAGLRRLPAIESAGGLTKPLLGNAFNGSSFETPPGVVERTIIESMSVTSGFLESAGLLPLDGRLPSAREFAQGAPVIVVSDLVARQYWPGRRAVDQVLVRDKRPFTVVGVVPDARYVALDRQPQGAIYSPVTADAEPDIETVLFAFKKGEPVRPDVVVDHLKRSCPVCAFRRAETLTQAMGRTIRIRQFRAWLFGAFGVSALVIVGIGILGLVAMTTSRRTKEVGIRMTVGATRRDVVRLLVREQMSGVSFGVAVGGLAAAWAVRYVSAYLYETPLSDPLIWFASVAILFSVALTGTLIPAARASRVDPIKALRVE